MPFVWDKTLLEEFIRIHIQIRSIIYDIKWYAFRENMQIPHYPKRIHCPMFVYWSVLFHPFPMQKPVQFDWISWSFRFPGGRIHPSLPDLPVFNQRRWSTERGEGQQEDVMMDLLDFVRMMWVKLGLWNPQFSKIIVTWWLHPGNGKNSSQGISSTRLGWNGWTKIQARWPIRLCPLENAHIPIASSSPFLFLKRHRVKWWSHGC